MPSSRGSPRPRDQTQVSRLLHWQAGSDHWRRLGTPEEIQVTVTPLSQESVQGWP